MAEVATPDPFVAAVITPPANVPLAPSVGALKVTTTPEPTGLPIEFFTIAESCVENALLIGVLWPPPPVAVIVGRAAGRFVNKKRAGIATPETDAVTM
jgi:hypothetical protein